MSPKSILITGASSGLGAALAVEYAAPGVTLGLLARNAHRLEQISQLCRNKGAIVVPGSVDVVAETAMNAWIHDFDRQYPIDLCIANAGISGGTGTKGHEALAQVKNIFDVNVNGVLNTVHPVIDCMKPRGHGQIAMISSIAGFRGIAPAPAYSVSKATVRYYGQALRALLETAGIKINVICPGFICTPMTDVNGFPMPMMMDAPKAARIIRAELARDKALIAFPWLLSVAIRAQNIFPDALVNRFYRALPAKPSKDV